MSTTIHPTALVDSKAELASGVVVGPYCTVGPNVKIGKGTKLVSHVVVDGWTTIGEENEIFPFATLGLVPQDLKYKGERTELTIGNRNSIREYVSAHLGTAQGGGFTRIGDGNLLMGYVHLGHDVIVGNSAILANYVGVAGHVVIDDHAIIGGQSGVNQFVRVGAHTYIGGHSAIERDVPPYCIGVGSRPMQIKGANIVGLRRRGFSADTISRINEAIKLWTRADVEKERCLLEIESQYGEFPEVMAFVNFIRKSESGVTR
ncbi:MAG: acyl-ACP--UDP-N-acetylglucosamine O-acyltransferase [Bdellovibrionales bacterium]|nr:acyl-ACP--UDP-N-acetylglucosamine O-acyltransferase [Bdellovibrionales bacterium]